MKNGDSCRDKDDSLACMGVHWAWRRWMEGICWDRWKGTWEGQGIGLVKFRLHGGNGES